VTTTKKIIVKAVIALAGLIAVLIWVQGGFHSKVSGGSTSVPGEKAVQAKTVKAEAVPTAGEVTVSGNVVARETAQVASRILGYVIDLKVDAGDKVKKGELLLRIDTREMAERQAQAQAALESAKAEFAQAKGDFERYKGLYEKEAAAKKTYDDALARYETAQAAEHRARAALDEAKTLLSYGNVTAAFDGVVSERSVNVGDLATPGRSLLTIYTPDTLELVAPVGEQYSPYLKPGGSVSLSIPSLHVTQASLLREVVPQRDVKTRTITVKAPLQEAPGLVPGLYGTLSFRTRTSEVIVVPKQAVHVVGQLESVRVLEDGKIRTRHVKTGRVVSDDKVEILSGLNPGEEVVVE
jgi:RND family efflux transporter MFP subunit